MRGTLCRVRKRWTTGLLRRRVMASAILARTEAIGTGIISSILSAFAYVPLTRGEKPSVLRQLAYREGTPLVGPEGDPEGWKVLAPVKVAGTIFDARKVELECTVCPLSLGERTLLTRFTCSLPLPLL